MIVNQWDGGTPDRFFLARTVRGNVWRIRTDVADDIAEALEELAADEPPLADPLSPPRHQAEYVRLLGGDPDGLVIQAGPVFRFSRPVPRQGRVVMIDGTTAHLLRGGLESWLPDVPRRQPMVVSVEQGRAASVCASVRITDRTHEAGVETVPGLRRRGHAAAAVAGWAREVRRQGVDLIFYSTSWQNTASQAVARRLGLTLIGADFSIH